MTFQLFTGNIMSGKSKALIGVAEKLSLQQKGFVIFFPSCCSNGESNKISSRNGTSYNAIDINEPLEIFQHISALTDAVLIDELQFIAKNEEQINDLLVIIEYLEKHNIDLYVAGLDLNYLSEPFVVTQAVMPYADKIKKFAGICSKCRNDNARKTVRFVDGKLSMPDEELLIEKSITGVKYKSVCSKCYYTLYKEANI